MFEPSIPAYPSQRSGPAIVCGSAWSLLEDYEKASRLRPGAFTICVNDAVKHVRPDAIFSMHYEKMPLWVSRARKAWPGLVCETHTASLVSERKLVWIAGNGGEAIDYIWPVTNAAGSSGWEAGKIAKRMGFDEVIFCGVQLALGNHQDGFEGWVRQDYVRDYRAAVMADSDYWAGMTAISGWLAEQLGDPQ